LLSQQLRFYSKASRLLIKKEITMIEDVSKIDDATEHPKIGILGFLILLVFA